MATRWPAEEPGVVREWYNVLLSSAWPRIREPALNLEARVYTQDSLSHLALFLSVLQFNMYCSSPVGRWPLWHVRVAIRWNGKRGLPDQFLAMGPQRHNQHFLILFLLIGIPSQSSLGALLLFGTLRDLEQAAPPTPELNGRTGLRAVKHLTSYPGAFHMYVAVEFRLVCCLVGR